LRFYLNSRTKLHRRRDPSDVPLTVDVVSRRTLAVLDELIGDAAGAIWSANSSRNAKGPQTRAFR
jgi:hypothetical protein